MNQREIRFRLWDKDLKRMRTVTRLNLDDWAAQVQDGSGLPIWLVTEEFELMQWVGLTDCNYTDIYEGDIIQYKTDESLLIFSIVRVKNMFCERLKTKNGFEHDYDGSFVRQSTYIKVIGNVYENPELIN